MFSVDLHLKCSEGTNGVAHATIMAFFFADINGGRLRLFSICLRGFLDFNGFSGADFHADSATRAPGLV